VASETKKMVSSAVSSAKKWGLRRIVVMLSPSYAKLAAPALEGALLGGYAYDRYLTKRTARPNVQIVCAAPDGAGLSRELRTRSSICEQVNFARQILNDPPNVKKPHTVARDLQRQGRAAGLQVTLWDSRRLARERCGGLLGVGQGSDAKPCLVIARYAPRGAKKHLCLVGKGITFDSGGYGIKPASAQIGMKYDMGGAAMVFAAACAIARLRLPLRLTVIVPLAENAISGRAYHTTSVLRTRSGRTAEVHHTDAEGRLILADGLTLAVEAKPDWIVDAATLTGACVVALGEDISGVYGTDSKFTRQLVEAGRREGELFWELPLHMPYEDQLKTTIADCKNVGSRWGGSITAAVFLKGWVPDGAKWIHCDIAGPAAKEEPLGPLGKGAKGHGVKTLVALAQDLAGGSKHKGG
jgi:leucyl aminopeptidase